jgi:CheY-like chemotaxis protein
MQAAAGLADNREPPAKTRSGWPSRKLPHGCGLMVGVLLVEDEVQILRLAESVLQQIGHDTLSAGTMAEAQAHRRQTMSLTRIFALRLALTFITGLASTAVAPAKELRFPETGDVAFVLAVPDNWEVSRVGPNLLLKGPDRSSSVALAVIQNKDQAKAPDDDLANAIFKASNAEPFSKHEPGEIGGIKAEAYFSKTTNTKNLTVLFRLMIVKVAKTYVVTETVVTLPDLSTAQQQSLDAVVKGITLTGIK